MLRISNILMAAVLGVATTAWADAPPATARVTDPAPAAPQTSSPYWNGQQQVSDLPATDIRTVPVARANSVRSYWTFQQSLFDLNNAVRVVKMQMDRQPEYVKAMADEKAAYDGMEKARVDALAGLTNNAAYAGAETLRKNVSGQIADEQDTPKPDPARLVAMARLKIQFIKDNRKLEAAALDRDAPYQDARRKYMDAAARVGQFRDAQMMAVASDETLISLRKQVAMARIEKVASRAFWDESIDARNIALDYAWYARGVDRYHGYGNGYGTYGGGYGGYGFGSGGGFRGGY